MGHVATCPGTCTQAIRHLSDTVQGRWSVREFAWGLVPCRAIYLTLTAVVLSTYSGMRGPCVFSLLSVVRSSRGGTGGEPPSTFFFFFPPSPLRVTARARHSTLASVLRPMQARHRGAPHGQVQSPIHPRLIRHVSAAGRGQWSGQETCLGARPV